MENQHCRIDQWLVAARFFKTRSLAVTAIKNGRILINGQRCKPARLLQLDDFIHIQKQSGLIFEVHVKVLATKRPSAKIAVSFYEETQESIARREQLAEQQKRARELVEFPQQRPDKRERRQLRDIHRNI